MRLNLISIHVSDFETSLHFYHDILGLPIVQQFPVGGSSIAFLGQAGQPQLEIIGFGKPEGKGPVGLGVSIGMLVDDLDKTMAELADKVPPFKGPVQPNPHTRFAFTTDPDGYTVQLLENC